MKRKTVLAKELFSFLLASTLLCSCFVSAAAAGGSELKIEYDGNTKIISNIQGVVSARSRSAQNASQSAAVWDLLREIGYTDEEIATLPEDLIAEYAAAEKIYAVVDEKTVDDSSGGIQPMSTIDPPRTYDSNKIRVVFTVTDAGYLNGRRAFTLNTVGSWKSTPAMTLKDIIAMAWTGNALSAGSAQSSCSMSYTRNLWSNGQCIQSSNLTAPAKDMEEVNNFPNYAMKYDIPSPSIIPQYTYTNIVLRATTKVTATGDFVACAGYGHQLITCSPNVSITNAGDWSIGLDFSWQYDEFYPGTIRVYY